MKTVFGPHLTLKGLLLSLFLLGLSSKSFGTPSGPVSYAPDGQILHRFPKESLRRYEVLKRLLKVAKESAEQGGLMPKVEDEQSALPPKSAHLRYPERWTLDERTEKEELLQYEASFSPSIVPYKRSKLYGELDENGDFVSGHSAYRRVREGKLDKPFIRFDADFELEGRAGEAIPIPSPAPLSSVLSFASEPPQALSFLVDELDQVFVVPERSGRFSLKLSYASPKDYFDRAFDEGMDFAALPRNLKPLLPAGLQERAESMAGKLGFDISLGYFPLLKKMVRWYRGFSAGSIDASGEAALELLTFSQTGICRHRAYSFVIMAKSLGIPARLVLNEAHAFVEVYLPDKFQSWYRIDLGGGAESLEIEGARGLEELGREHEELFSDSGDYQGMAGADVLHFVPRAAVGKTIDSLIDDVPEDESTHVPRLIVKTQDKTIPKGGHLYLDILFLRKEGAPKIQGSLHFYLYDEESRRITHYLESMEVNQVHVLHNLTLPSTLGGGRYHLGVHYEGKVPWTSSLGL